jgi:hypothetical protein
MGFFVDRQYQIPVVHHGGSMLGFKSDMIFLPDHDVAAVILTNADEGQTLLGPFRRRLLELLFDAKPEAAEDVKTAVKNMRAATLEERSHLTLPPDASVVSKLAPRYRNASLGGVAVTRSGAATAFDFGEWKCPVASRKNDDGTVAIVTAAPGFNGLPFIVGDKDGKRTLTVRDAQHEYVFVETE